MDWIQRRVTLAPPVTTALSALVLSAALGFLTGCGGPAETPVPGHSLFSLFEEELSAPTEGEQSTPATGGLPPLLAALPPDQLEAIRMDSAGLAAHLGVPIDQVAEMILERQEAQPVITAVEKGLGDTYAGLAIDYRADGWGVVVWSTNPAADVSDLTDGTRLEDQVEMRPAEYSLRQLNRALRKAQSVLSDLPLEAGIDVPANRAIVYVLSLEELDAYLQENGLWLPSEVIVEEVESFSSPAANE